MCVLVFMCVSVCVMDSQYKSIVLNKMPTEQQTSQKIFRYLQLYVEVTFFGCFFYVCEK